MGSSVIHGNNVGVDAVSGASLLSYANIQVTGNISNGRFMGGAGLQCRSLFKKSASTGLWIALCLAEFLSPK